MHDSGLRVFTELKAMQHSDAVMPRVIDTLSPFFLHTAQCGAPCKKKKISSLASGSILRLVGPSLRFC